MSNKKEAANKRKELNVKGKRIEITDVAIGSSVTVLGILFLALIFMKGSDDPVVESFKKESKSAIKTFFF